MVSQPGNDRFCLDACKLNALTVKDPYPLPCIEGILARIDQTFYTSYWQVKLDEKSRPYTAITVPGRPLYQFRVMQFEFCNAA